MNSGIWVRLIRKNHIVKDIVEPCAWEDWQDALAEALHKMDVAHPVILEKNTADFEQFSQTRFMPDAFLESVPFDRLEVEFIDPDRKKSVNEKYL